MKISRDVILDLLPLYQSGEASEATKALVETWMAEHPNEANLIERSMSLELPEDLPVAKENREMNVLAQTKFYLKLRGFLFGAAIFSSCMPFAFGDTSFDNVEGVHWLWQDNPMIAFGFAGLALVLWTAYLLISKRLKVTGL